MKTITILTPTYNRKEEIKKLYKSLCKQTSVDFKWMIIDDGSLDCTDQYIKSLNDSKFEIKYIKKNNGGKHTALNVGFSNLDTELVAIVDSDDQLIPTAIETIIKYWEKYKDNKKLMGLVFKKKAPNNKEVSQKFKKKEFIDNYNNYVINQNIKGDKFEIFKVSIIKEYHYPIFKGEKFIGEGVLWSKISRKYDTVFIDKAIYVCEYMEGGLTNCGRKMRLKNPYGGMYHSEEYLDNIYTLKVREKNALLYLLYARVAKMNIYALIKKKNNSILLIINVLPSLILYKLWSKKYLNRKEH